VDHSNNLEAFRGIRYALPPVNDLRFRRPKMVWDGPLPDILDPHNRTTKDGKFDASFYGPSCSQYVPPAFMAYRPPAPPGSSQVVSSEDCLSEYDDDCPGQV
jgi:carboxylesterase type B